MPIRQRLHIALDLEQGPDPLQGTLRTRAGDSYEFWGWLQLIQRIEDAIRADVTQPAAERQARSNPTLQEDADDQVP